METKTFIEQNIKLILLILVVFGILFIIFFVKRDCILKNNVANVAKMANDANDTNDANVANVANVAKMANDANDTNDERESYQSDERTPENDERRSHQSDGEATKTFENETGTHSNWEETFIKVYGAAPKFKTTTTILVLKLEDCKNLIGSAKAKLDLVLDNLKNLTDEISKDETIAKFTDIDTENGSNTLTVIPPSEPIGQIIINFIERDFQDINEKIKNSILSLNVLLGPDQIELFFANPVFYKGSEVSFENFKKGIINDLM